MRKSTKIMTLILAGAVVSTAAFTGCSLVSQNPQADMNQVISEVDISKSEKFDASLADYKGAITNKSIYKRDLVAYFLNQGSSLVQEGYTYGQAFETLASTLVNNEILIQYATVATLKDMVENENYTEVSSATAAVEKFLSFETEAQAYEWILSYQSAYDEYEGDENVDYVTLSKYTLYSAINSSIDSYEESILDTQADDETSEATLPSGVDETLENYYPVKDGKLDYAIYTGYDGYLLTGSGAYQDDALEGTTRYTRMAAYNNFIQTLDNNYLITDDDNIKDVLSLNFVQDEYLSILRQQVVSNYYDFYEAELEEAITAGDYKYIENRYNELLAQQDAQYGSSNSDFETAMGNLSDKSFILTTPANNKNGNSFGYVYNILLPFSAAQTRDLTALSAQLENDVITESEYYAQRNAMLKNITTTDQRSSWFNGGVDYSFDASTTDLTYYKGKNDDRNILFFENNLVNTDKYGKLDKYIGKYTYNGTAIKNEDGSYTLIPNKLNIDNMLSEVEGYINFIFGDGKLTFNKTSGYYDVADFTYGVNSEGKKETDIDYSKFIYAQGTINLGEFVSGDLLNENSDYYKAMSAINELQYAYTTDTSVLSQFIGYTVSAYSTSYIKEFEYAAQQAINKGAGNFVVCAGDYGWHIMYVTYVLTPGSDTYTPDWSRITAEGTFENLFYEMLKSSDLENASSRKQRELLQTYYEDGVTVKVYESRYSDLTSLTTSASES